MERKFSFDLESLQFFIVKAAEYLAISVDKKAIADDFIESLCIIVKDGDNYSFLHRSFQEYATAMFLCTERVNNLPSILEKLNDNVNDDVVELSFFTNQELIEQEYILPRLERLLKEFRRLRSIRKKILLFYSGISLEKSHDDEERFFFSIGSHGSTNVSNAHFAMFVRRSYRTGFDPNLSKRITAWLRKEGGFHDGKNIRVRIEFDTTREKFVSAGPMKELVDSYFSDFLKVRDEIVNRRRHQSQMLRL